METPTYCLSVAQGILGLMSAELCSLSLTKTSLLLRLLTRRFRRYVLLLQRKLHVGLFLSEPETVLLFTFVHLVTVLPSLLSSYSMVVNTTQIFPEFGELLDIMIGKS